MQRNLLGAAVALATLSSCAPRPASAAGTRINSLYDVFLWIAAVIFVIVAGLIALSIFSFRDKAPRARTGDDAELPPQFHTNLKLEILWFAIPTVIVVFLFISSIGVLGDVNYAEPDSVTVEVTGFQWGWRFEYEGVTLESLPGAPATVVLPTDVPLTFKLNSPDVIHSFYIPRFLIKRDVLPDRENRLDLVIEDPGTYRGACAEFCGLLHARMDFDIQAVELEEWQSWLADQQTEEE